MSSLIERHSVELQTIDGVKREVLTVWAMPACERFDDLITEAEELWREQFGHCAAIHINIPPASSRHDDEAQFDERLKRLVTAPREAKPAPKAK